MVVGSIHPPAQMLPTVPDPVNPNWLQDNRELIQNVKAIDPTELFGEGHELTFALDRETRRPVVRVVNRQTQEVLWQAPPEYVLQLAQAMSSTSRG